MVAVGLAAMILFQVLVNVGMVIGIMPVTGIPLPFVTYGGSSLISLLFGHGHPAIGPHARPQADVLGRGRCASALAGSVGRRLRPRALRAPRLGLDRSAAARLIGGSGVPDRRRKP